MWLWLHSLFTYCKQNLQNNFQKYHRKPNEFSRYKNTPQYLQTQERKQSLALNAKCLVLVWFIGSLVLVWVLTSTPQVSTSDSWVLCCDSSCNGVIHRACVFTPASSYSCITLQRSSVFTDLPPVPARLSTVVLSSQSVRLGLSCSLCSGTAVWQFSWHSLAFVFCSRLLHVKPSTSELSRWHFQQHLRPS